MALGAQIYKANVSLSNLDNHIYEDLSLTIALHPSETVERMMFRLVAFLISYHERLEFTNGLENPDLPDIWQKDLTGDIEHWIELGQPDEKKIKKGSNKSNKVSIYTYNSYKSEIWLNKISGKIQKGKNISIYELKENEESKLTDLVQRTLTLNCMIEDNSLYLSNDNLRVEIKIINSLN